MKNIAILLFVIYCHNALATCSSTITRTSFSPGTTISSSTVNSQFNTVYNKVNNLDGDCITDASLPKAALEAGAFYKTITAATTTYTALSTDEVITASAGSAFTISLPTAVGISGKEYVIKKIDSSVNAVTIDPNSTETIDGSLTAVINTQYATVRITSNGANWIVTERPVIKSFSTDETALTYASSGSYTISTLNTAPVGTFITYTYASSTNTLTQTTSAAPSQSTGSMATDGIRVFSRAYNATSTSGNPAYVAVQIGKNLKNIRLFAYGSTGKTLSLSLDMFINSSDAGQSGFTYKEYNESTGVLVLDAGHAISASNTSRVFRASDGTTTTSAYVVINGTAY